MLARLRAGQRDGRRRQADDDFGWWRENYGPILVADGPKFMTFLGRGVQRCRRNRF